MPIGVAIVKGTYDVTVGLHDQAAPNRLRLTGAATGALGHGDGQAWVFLKDLGEGRTELAYRYSADVGGKIASVGQRVLKTATKVLIAQFFESFTRRIKGADAAPSILARLRAILDRLLGRRER